MPNDGTSSTGNYQRYTRKRLNCGCVLRFPIPAPDNGDEVWCQFHRRMQLVLHSEDGQWKAKCRNCTYSRQAGANKSEAEGKAVRHYMRKTSHMVDVFRPDGELEKTYGAAANAQLDLTSDIPPF